MSESVVVFKMSEDNLDIDEVTQELLVIISGWLQQEDCYTTDVQQQMLESHLRAMVARAKRVKRYQKSISVCSMRFRRTR